MVSYVGAVVILGLLIDGLLLIAAGRLCGCKPTVVRLVWSVLADGLYTYLCLQPSCLFLGNTFFRLICLVFIAVVAFGTSKRVWRSTALYVILDLALGGSAFIVGRGGLVGTLCTAGVICALFYMKLDSQKEEDELVPVELQYGNKRLHLTALRDTGNTLRDPLTGQCVLVIGSDAAGELTGLTKEQLRHPLDFVGSISGLRLIPYHTVDSGTGFLLAMKLHKAKIG